MDKENHTEKILDLIKEGRNKMPYAKKFKHPWNLQWYESPFVRYLANYRRSKRRKNRKSDVMKVMTVFTALKVMTNWRCDES